MQGTYVVQQFSLSKSPTSNVTLILKLFHSITDARSHPVILPAFIFEAVVAEFVYLDKGCSRCERENYGYCDRDCLSKSQAYTSGAAIIPSLILFFLILVIYWITRPVEIVLGCKV